MNRLSALTFVAALALGAIHSSDALANVEIGGVAGVHVFSEDNELGVQDFPQAPSVRNSVLFGLRVGAFFGNIIGVEGEFGVVPSEARVVNNAGGYSITNLTYRAHLIAQFRAANPENKFIPFVLVGGGAFSIVDSNSGNLPGVTGTRNEIDTDTDAMFYVGVGAKYRISNSWGVRFDARLLVPPSSENDTPPSPDVSKVTVDFEALASVYVSFGGGSAATQPDQPPPDDDPDKDGIVGDADRCPMDPEDKDAFQDDDGCPDPDNDGDGVLDANDRCPTDAEDKDGFQDDDGCPDPDNDGDGILDSADKCPDQPETKNGFQDEDGCPDDIPEKVKKFTGAIQGINFRVNSSDLLPVSNRTLDQAVAVLKEFPDVKIEIGGHTDDQPIKKKGKFADNLELSQARAESVRAYFIKKGVDESRITAKGYGDSVPVVDPAGLKGNKLNTARSKNRRVEFKLI